MRLPSTSSPTTLSSRMPTSSGRWRRSPISRSPYCVTGPLPGVTRPSYPRSEPFHHPVDALGERADVVGLDGREHRRPAAGCGRVCGTARCRRCRWPAAPWPPRRHPRRRRSRSVPTTCDRSSGSATNGVANVRRLGPRVQPLRRVGGALDGPVQPAVAQHPVELLGEQDQRADRRGVVGLVLECCSRRRSAATGSRAPSVRTPAIASMRASAAGDRSASHSPPSPAKFFCGAK